MASDSLKDHFPFDTYRDYVSALSATDNAYESLRDFFSSSSDDPFGPQIHAETQVPRSGAVMIMDSTATGRLEMDRYPVGENGSGENARRCIDAFNERHIVAKNRLVSISYHRDPFTGEYTGLNTDIINAVGHRYRIHPEILMWHFGSDFGLDQRFFPFAAPPIPSALSSRRVCHLRHHHSLFSFCLHTSKGPDMENTVIIFARNLEFQNWGLLVSRLKFLDSSLPLPPAEPASRWSNDLFVQALFKLAPEEAAACFANPIEYIIPYAQMILISATFVMDTWANKVMHPRGKTSSNLEVHYDKQLSVLNEIRQNLDALKVFTTDNSSMRWKSVIMDYQRVLESAEQQINVVLAQKMTYRAAMASLDESRISIEHARRSIEQNDRVKKLTQLAFIFIPLGFSTSAFGMNLEVLGTGKANIWMVLVAIVLVYFSTGLLWMLLHYQDTIAKITAVTSQTRPVGEVFNLSRREKSRISTV